MSNYTKTTNFATKDSLPSGNPAKIVKGTEIDTEFNNIAVANATKLDSSTVSAFGATLIDDADASAARTTLGLGTAATTAATDYATAAQGVTADAALPTTGGAMTGAITTNSTFDGRDVATDGTKLDGIEAGATADQTAAQIKTAYESNADTNAFTDADHTKLDGIEASADVTDTTNVVAALSAGTGISLSAGGEIANTAPDQTVALTGGGGTTISGTYPNFTITSSSSALPTATSTVLGGVELFSDTEQTVAANAVTATASRTYGIQLNSDDQAVINVPWTDTTYSVGDGGLTEINFTSADNTKLGNIEASADVTDTANVTTAGALMDSEVTNLAQVKAFDSSDYATAAQGTLAAAALPTSGGAMTGAITTNSTFDGVDIATRDGVLTTTTNTANAALPKAGGTMTGAIAMGTSKITGAGDPTAAQDVATKAYVDANAGGAGTLQETLALGNTTTTDTKIQFRDTGLYINSSVDGQLDIVADTEVQLAATTFDINAAVVTNGDVTVGDDLSLLSDSSKINFGLNSDVSLTHQHNLGLLLNGTSRLYFNDTSQYINAPSTTTLDINATSEIELNATLIDVNGELDVSGNIVVAGTVDGRDVAADGVTADAALPKAGGTMTGALTSGSDGTGHDVKFFGDTAGHYMLYDASTDNLNLIGAGSSLFVGGSLITDAAGSFTDQGGSNFLAAITEDSDTLSGSGAVTINLNNATNWLHDLSGNTTYTFTYPTTSNAQVSSSFTLKIIQGTTARTITWPSSVDWAGGTAPTLSTVNNAVDVFVFYTIDSGTTWYGFTAGQAMA